MWSLPESWTADAHNNRRKIKKRPKTTPKPISNGLAPGSGFDCLPVGSWVMKKSLRSLGHEANGPSAIPGLQTEGVYPYLARNGQSVTDTCPIPHGFWAFGGNSVRRSYHWAHEHGHEKRAQFLRFRSHPRARRRAASRRPHPRRSASEPSSGNNQAAGLRREAQGPSPALGRPGCRG
jgi:hypothetical protein